MAFFYCSFANAESLIVKNVLGSILAQICMSNPAIQDKVASRVLESRKPSLSSSSPSSLGEAAMVDLISESLQEREDAYILVDGINECDDPQLILSWLSLISNSSLTCSIHLFISSINEKDIESAMEPLPNVMRETLQHGDIQNDVHSLVRASLNSDPRLRRHSPELKEEIEWALTTGAKGM